MSAIIINPGSGPVDDTKLEYAIDNIKHYITDCDLKDVEFIHLAESDEDGRYRFMLYKKNRCPFIGHLVDMPGWPLDKVRYVQEKGQNAWNFPRLYVDESSWLWCFGMLSEKDFDTEKWNEDR